MKRLLLVLMLSCQSAAPTTRSVTPPLPDASDASFPDLGTQVCMHLAAINCAQPATCVDVINTKQGTTTDFKVKCLLSAHSPAEADNCGTIHCN